MLFFHGAIRANEAIALYQSQDLTDVGVRATGFFPSRRRAECYMTARALAGYKGDHMMHPHANSPPYIDVEPETLKQGGQQAERGRETHSRTLTTDATDAKTKGAAQMQPPVLEEQTGDLEGASPQHYQLSSEKRAPQQ